MRRAHRIGMSGPAGQTVQPLSWAGTFHAVGNRLLRLHAESIGLTPSFTILDRSDAADLMNLVRQDLNLSAKEKRFPQKATCLSIYSLAVNSGAILQDVLERHFPWCAEWEEDLRVLFRVYVEAKQKQNVLDYDDLLLYWARMVAVPELGRAVGDRFDFILVDEYQDTNSLQAKILFGMKSDGTNILHESLSSMCGVVT